MLKRELDIIIRGKMDSKKVIVLYGPRQVGKTTLINAIIEEYNQPTLFITGDNPSHRIQWANPSWSTIQQLIAPFNFIFIDEAQRIENIGLSVKMIIDSKQNKQVFLTGSSSINLADSMRESLTGRKWEYTLYPFSWSELKKARSLAGISEQLEEFLIYGMYPEVILTKAHKMETLRNLAGSYLYKDIMEQGGIRKPDVVSRLLQALAWQVGNEVSYNELAQTIQSNKETVMRYIYLLESAFVIFRLDPLSRNPRNEISSSRKIYFYDNGIRNAILDNFSTLSVRNDIGALWENFFIAERKKIIEYQQLPARTYFWRSKSQSEIDYIEEINGEMTAYEIKWNEKAKIKFPASFLTSYHPKECLAVNKGNYWDKLE